jgi:RimJ/RimL family protein N-acetyltransferase
MEDPSFDHFTVKRLVIRRFAAGDAEALASYRSDAEVARYQDWESPYPVSEARKFIASLHHLAPGVPGTWFQFAVSLAPSDTLIGDVALRTRADGRQVELGFTFASAHQGQGHATEAVRAVVQYAFGPLAMHRVCSRTDARNLRAQRLLERVGFRREGELRASVWFKGGWATDLLYAQLESEWRP